MKVHPSGERAPRGPSLHATDLRGAIAIGLQEALAALEEALDGLTEAQVRAFPMLGEESIAVIAMRALQELDVHAVVSQGGAPSFEHSDRWSAGPATEALGLPQSSGAFPSRSELVERLAAVRANAERLLAQATTETLLGPSAAPELWPGSASGAYLSAIYHTFGRVQRIWLLRGLLRATGLSAVEREREAAEPGPDAPRAVAELHYRALVEGDEPLWRTTLIAEHRSPRRVAGSWPQRLWEAGRRAAKEQGVRYEYLRESDREDGHCRLLFQRLDPSGAPLGAPVPVQLALSEEGWRVEWAGY